MYTIDSNENYGIYIMFGVASRNNGTTDAISAELKNLGFTMDNTLQELISMLVVDGDKKQRYIRLEVNSNSSNFNNSLPITGSANVLEIHLTGNGRGYARCFYISNGGEYTAHIHNGTIGSWYQIQKTKVTQST